MITHLIFDQAKQSPDRTAVLHNGRALSYGSLARWIAVARGCFHRRGCVGRGYALLAVHSLLDFWILSLALRSLGLTTVAAPSSAEIGRLGLPDLRFVVTTPLENWPGLPELCAGRGLPLLSVTLAGEGPLWPDAAHAAHPPGGHVLQTSGTTGEYKMVLMSPECDAVMLRRKAELIGMDRDTVLCVFNFGPWTAVGYRWAASPWTVGGAIVIEEGGEPYRALSRPGITHAVLVPGMLAAVLSAPAGAFPRKETMRLTVGGGAMTRAQVDQARARITPRLFNLLASTEGGVIAHTSLDTPEDHRWHRLAPGRVVQVVDDSDRPLPPGEVGRVRVATDGGPTGYLNDEATTRLFFRDGFFYPGDLAVTRSDGRMALQGRVTDIINARGQKISPSLIEDRLCDLLGVSGVCLFSMQNEQGEEDIHVVVETPAPIESARMIAAIGQELRAFAHAHVHYVAALARNRMGKVLRQEVRAQALAARASSAKADPTRS